MPQLRQNVITGEWVVIAPERAKRPSDFIQPKGSVRTDVKDECVFCAHGLVYKTQNLREYESAQTYVVRNKFPAFVEDETMCEVRTMPTEHHFYRMRPSVGGHDVVVVKEHDQNLPTFSQQIWEALLQTFVRRISYFHETCNVEYAMPIYNHKPAAGASVFHPHAQIMASNIIPNYVMKEIHGAERYYEHEGTCVFCDLNAHELAQKTRVIFVNNNFIAYTFYAARFPFEVWVLPRAHQSKFESISASERRSLGECMRAVTALLDKTLHDPALNFFIHSTPNTITAADPFHWHIELTPRITQYGGYELGSGVVIDVVSPEKAAGFLREHNRKS